jgi:hypothetical protein
MANAYPSRQILGTATNVNYAICANGLVRLFN